MIRHRHLTVIIGQTYVKTTAAETGNSSSNFIEGEKELSE